MILLIVIAGVIVVGGNSITFSSESRLHLAGDDRNLSVIVVSIDPMRADHLPCYGYHRNTAPNICAFAERSYQFQEAYATAVWTLPSMGTVWSSDYAQVHGAVGRLEDQFSPVGPTLAELFGEAGYDTAGFVSPGFVSPKWGVDKGFDTYRVARLPDAPYTPHVYQNHSVSAGFNRTSGLAMDWLQTQEDPFFLYVQGFDTHPPFRAPKPYRGRYSSEYDGVLRNYTLDFIGGRKVLSRIYYTRNGPVLRTKGMSGVSGTGRGNRSEPIPLDAADLQYIRDRYDEEIRHVDAVFGAFLRQLKEQEVMNRTVIVFMSSHGEILGDRKVPGRPMFGRIAPRQGSVHVPLLIRVPSREGQGVSGMVSLIDLMPTLVTALSIGQENISDTMQGKSFSQIFAGRTAERETVFFANRFRGIVGLATDRYKYWRTATDQEYLFNLDRDPEEARDISGERPNLAGTFGSKLERFEHRLVRFRLSHRN